MQTLFINKDPNPKKKGGAMRTAIATATARIALSMNKKITAFPMFENVKKQIQMFKKIY